MHSRFFFRRIGKTIKRSNDQTIKRVAIVAALAAMIATGCDKETRLNSNLEETQANLIVAALLDAGISAHKSPGDEGAWNVEVAQSRFADAANLLARTIAGIDGVLDARVHIVLPENDPFARNALPSSAAVAIRARYDADLADYIPSIKGLVKNAIEGLAFEKISVTVFQDPPPAKK